MRELTYKALINMINQEVWVQDLEYDEYIQKCVVKQSNTLALLKNGKIINIKKLYLENEEFVFEFDQQGRCLNGEFKVFSIDKRGEI